MLSFVQFRDPLIVIFQKTDLHLIKGYNTNNYSGTTNNYYEQKRLVYTRVVLATTKKTATIKLYKIP